MPRAGWWIRCFSPFDDPIPSPTGAAVPAPRVSLGLTFLRRAGLGLTVLAAGGCGGLPELPLDALPLSPLASFAEPDPAITTSIRDAQTEAPFLDVFRPADPVSLSSLPRGPNDGFLLPGSGFFALNTRSYCLHAGTYGPTEGNGYVYAPLLGPRAALIRRMAQNSVDHPEISQMEVQTLIWAIQSHTSLHDTPRAVQRTAAVLLSEDDLRSLDDAAVDILAGAARERAYAHLPEAARRVLRAEDQLRNMLTQGQSTYEELERAAVLAGVPPREDDDREVPWGRWSYHPDGYFVRYYPNGYRQLEVQLYVPEPAVLQRDNRGRIVSVADRTGNHMEVEFDEETAPLEPQEAPGLSAHPFRTIRSTRYRAVGPEIALEETDTLSAPGWAFLGTLPEENEIQADGLRGPVGDQAQTYTGMTERMQAVRDLRAELRTLTDHAPDLGRKIRPGTSRARDFIDLVHLDQGLRAAVESGGLSNGGASPGGASIGEAEVTAALDLVTKAWLYLLVSADGEPASGWKQALDRGSTLGWGSPAGWGPVLDWGSAAGWGPAAGCGETTPTLTSGPSLAFPSPEPWPVRLANRRIPQDQGICDDIPEGQGGGQEYDPTDGTATPGSTGRQRLLPSGANADDENSDCGKVAAALAELNTVRNAYASTQPRPGESGTEYAKRIEVDLFGLNEKDGAVSPMGTELGSCVILGNRAFYNNKPPIVRTADCTHERVHQATCRWARDHAMGGFEGWSMNPQNYRQNELDAYAAGIKVLEDWMAANGCSGE